MTDVRMEIYFSGTVQGVGFRYTSLQVSRSFEVVGTVQNLSDGRVKMIVEGEPVTIKRFIHDVTASIQGHVSATEELQKRATGEFSAFEIVR